VDLQGLFNVQSLTERSNASDELLAEFLRQYIIGVWPYDTVPSYQDMANVLNAVGILSPTGAKWSLHNLQQKLARMNFDRQLAMEQRGVLFPAVPDVSHRLAKAAEYVETIKPVEDEKPLVRSMRPALVWAEAGMPMPEDMPTGKEG
jgi:hypothetical protein